MSKTSKTLRKMCALAGICVLAATASAIPVDARIMIDRALNSPTLTVRYEGANAALVELRVNGESLGTRQVSSAKTTGETNFTLNLTELKDGDNDIEIRLYDRTGKLVGTDKSSISTDQTNYGPVFLKTPKVGATVTGNVEITMGFGRELKDVFVSFFVDNNFKKMTNYPPFTLNWDTTGETKGWHEVEAWAIDASGTTYKTRKTRIFVDNPGGNTDRVGVSTDAVPSKNPSYSTLTDNPRGLKSMTIKSSGKPVSTSPVHTAPRETGTTIGNDIASETASGTPSGLKPAPLGKLAVAGARNMTPTFSRDGEPVRRAAGRISPMTVHPAAPGGRVSTLRADSATFGAKSVARSAVPAAPSRGSFVAMSRTAKPASGSIDISLHRQTGTALSRVAAATNLVRIVKGQRLPNLTTFEVVLNSAIVDFPDVQPRVDDGVPMTPLRYLLEKDGGVVDWENLTKTVSAKAEGRDIVLQIGDRSAKVNKLAVSLEVAPYIERGRTIVPLSFIHDALKVNVEYDKETGHVLITSDK